MQAEFENCSARSSSGSDSRRSQEHGEVSLTPAVLWQKSRGPAAQEMRRLLLEATLL